MRWLLVALFLLCTPAIAATQPQTTSYTSTQTGTAVCTPTPSACTPPSSTCFNCVLEQKTAVMVMPLASGSPQSGGGGTAPVVTAFNCNVQFPITNATTVNQTAGGACGFAATCGGVACTGSNAITSWAISTQTCTSCYSVTNGGLLQGGSNAASILTGSVSTVTVTATNTTGTSPGVAQTITTVSDAGPSQALFSNPYYSCNQNWYVGNFGSGSPSDSNSGTSQSAPWATLAHANSTITTTGTGSWCVTTATGFNSSAGTAVTKGGTVASSAGYVVYKCQTLNGCTITDPGNNGSGQGLHAAFAVQASYVMIDGFILAASSAANLGVGIEVFNGTNNYNSTGAAHHVWSLNNIITGYGLSGIGWSHGEYFGVIHTKASGNSANSGCNGGPQGSGIAINEPFPTAGYTPTADDHSNIMIGTTGTLVKNWVMWNVATNNHVAGCGGGGSTDGNGITMDTWNWNCYTGGSSSANCTSGASPYLGGVLEAFNVVYNNGGGGIHNNQAPYAIVANNSCYNNYTDTGFQSGGNLPCIDDNGSWANVFINNTSYVPGNANPTRQIAIGPFGPGGSSQNNFNTTLANSGGITSSGTSVQLAGTTNMPNGTSGMAVSGSYALPGGNMIYVGTLPTSGGVGTGELMLVTAGWGTSTLTVVRGYQGTTAASHAQGTKITWVPDYFSNNVTYATGSNGSLDGSTQTFSGDVYPPSQNLTNTNVNYTNVGNSSTGSDSTQPNGANFALGSGSAAINYGQTSTNSQTFLPVQSVDAGACYHSLTTCP
jgi:hypothetical protein